MGRMNGYPTLPRGSCPAGSLKQHSTILEVNVFKDAESVNDIFMDARTFRKPPFLMISPIWPNVSL